MPHEGATMNTLSFADFRTRLAHRLRLRIRLLDPHRGVDVFTNGDEVDALQRIYVINLDRKLDRWRRQRSELDRFRERHGERLSTLTRRFSAVDARYLDPVPDPQTIRPAFSLAEQLTVDPNPLLQIDDQAEAHEIKMTQQEVAVALSHIEVWRLIAKGEVLSALILEDDVFFAPGFAKNLRMTWAALTTPHGELQFDLLYLAFRDLHPPTSGVISLPKRRLEPGVWEASGYVLSRDGARKLLDRLPVHGPIDLWLNLQFTNLRVFTAAKRLIEQRIDEPSTNAYSVLPVLSQVGAITREKPLVHGAKRLTAPVIALGPKESGLTALAKALSMVGYTCISDLHVLPPEEHLALRSGKKNRAFNAYVNIGCLTETNLHTVATIQPHARFIVTGPDHRPCGVPQEKVLCFGPDIKDKWAALSEFLEIEYPSFPYPDDEDFGQRQVADANLSTHGGLATDLRFDTSPWILRSNRKKWRGIRIAQSVQLPDDVAETTIRWPNGTTLDENQWMLRTDTFPSNLALFKPANFDQRRSAPAVMTFREEKTAVRQFTSAAIASRETYLYGTFGAELRPSNVPGLITGVFLHRNGPRQEIDIEFLGKDTTTMLVNVYYNPGPVGTRLEYGYRGTPTQVSLGFDAAEEFHTYEIEWHREAIRWKVDGAVVYERLQWNPTPIPDLPLEFNVNLWHSRSEKFAGRLAIARTPATAEIRSIELQTPEVHVPSPTAAPTPSSRLITGIRHHSPDATSGL
jgi:GR25 family glycosyltransferase involved in LPS biosynthesis